MPAAERGNVFANKPIHNMDELKDLPIRMQGAPIWTRVFEAIGAAPTVIAYDEVYNAIQTGVIEAAENEAAGIEQMKFYEVGPYVVADPACDHRAPALSSPTRPSQRLPPKLQECIVTAGKPRPASTAATSRSARTRPSSRPWRTRAG